MQKLGTTKALLKISRASTMKPFKLLTGRSKLIHNMQMPGTAKAMPSLARARITSLHRLTIKPSS